MAVQSPRTSILEELRSSTRSQHEAMEGLIPVSSVFSSLQSYRALLQRFYGFYSPLELRLSRISSLDRLLPDYPKRRKTPLLRRDLEFLGLYPEQIQLCRRLPRVDSLSEAFGVLYVIEGSTLGGQILSRTAQQNLNISGNEGASFFSSYGSEVGSMWRKFREAVERYSRDHPDESNRILCAARESFQYLGDWLKKEAASDDPVNAGHIQV